MSSINEKHDSMPLSCTGNGITVQTIAAESPNRVQGGVTGVKATLQRKSRSPSINKRREGDVDNTELENSPAKVPPFLIMTTANPVKHKEELFLVEDNPSKQEEIVET